MNTANSAEVNVNSWTNAISRANSAEGNIQHLTWAMFVTTWDYMIPRNELVNSVQWRESVKPSKLKLSQHMNYWNSGTNYYENSTSLA